MSDRPLASKIAYQLLNEGPAEWRGNGFTLSVDNVNNAFLKWNDASMVGKIVGVPAHVNLWPAEKFMDAVRILDVFHKETKDIGGVSNMVTQEPVLHTYISDSPIGLLLQFEKKFNIQLSLDEMHKFERGLHVRQTENMGALYTNHMVRGNPWGYPFTVSNIPNGWTRKEFISFFEANGRPPCFLKEEIESHKPAPLEVWGVPYKKWGEPLYFGDGPRPRVDCTVREETHYGMPVTDLAKMSKVSLYDGSRPMFWVEGSVPNGREWTDRVTAKVLETIGLSGLSGRCEDVRKRVAPVVGAGDMDQLLQVAHSIEHFTNEVWSASQMIVVVKELAEVYTPGGRRGFPGQKSDADYPGLYIMPTDYDGIRSFKWGGRTVGLASPKISAGGDYPSIVASLGGLPSPTQLAKLYKIKKSPSISKEHSCGQER